MRCQALAPLLSQAGLPTSLRAVSPLTYSRAQEVPRLLCMLCARDLGSSPGLQFMSAKRKMFCSGRFCLFAGMPPALMGLS